VFLLFGWNEAVIAGRFCAGGRLELGMIDVCWIAVIVAMELAGGSVVA
jgi:hypothetical protein